MNVGDKVRTSPRAGFYGNRRGVVKKANNSGRYRYLVEVGRDVVIGFTESELELVEAAPVENEQEPSLPLANLREAVIAARKAGHDVTCKVTTVTTATVNF